MTGKYGGSLLFIRLLYFISPHFPQTAPFLPTRETGPSPTGCLDFSEICTRIGVTLIPECMRKESHLDTLASQLMAHPSDMAFEALWKEVFQLPHWYFLARKTQPTVEPFFALIDNKPWLCVFSDPERLYEFASLQGIVQFPGQEVDVFSLDSVKGFAYALQYLKTDIHGVWFDLPQGFNAPLATFRDIGLYLGTKYIGTDNIH